MSEGWKGPESEKALNMRWGGGKVKEVLEVPGKVIWVEQSIFTPVSSQWPQKYLDN